MNTTTQAIIARLPKKPLLAPADIAAAYGLATTKTVLQDIATGRLPANIVGNRYIISHQAAEEYIKENEFIPDEGEIKK